MVHLTTDVLSQVFSSPQCLWLPLSNTIHLEPGCKAQGEGVGKFAGLPNHITCVTLHNINDVTPPGHFEYDKAPLWTKNGKKLITAERYTHFLGFYHSNIDTKWSRPGFRSGWRPKTSDSYQLNTNNFNRVALASWAGIASGC